MEPEHTVPAKKIVSSSITYLKRAARLNALIGGELKMEWLNNTDETSSTSLSLALHVIYNFTSTDIPQLLTETTII
ncbi:MAG: hypothetical protein CME32_04435 [Gimesia sp.]|nr:hypothetical protein [Gimesia sp.]